MLISCLHFSQNFNLLRHSINFIFLKIPSPRTHLFAPLWTGCLLHREHSAHPDISLHHHHRESVHFRPMLKGLFPGSHDSFSWVPPLFSWSTSFSNYPRKVTGSKLFETLHVWPCIASLARYNTANWKSLLSIILTAFLHCLPASTVAVKKAENI